MDESTASPHSSPGTLSAAQTGLTLAWVAEHIGGALLQREVPLPPLGTHDVEVEISHCGVCHSDVHLVDDAWRISQFPLVPGHEIVGVVRDMGAAVDHVRVGARVGVGWQCGSCGACKQCIEGRDNLCADAATTCNGHVGGFAARTRVDGRYAFRLPEGLESAQAAPLLCGGVTVFAPLARAGVGPGGRVGVVGIGGLGHLAIQYAAAMGAEVSAISTSPDKRAEALSFGAERFVAAGDIRQERGRYDMLLSTVHADLPWQDFVRALRPRGVLVMLGAPPQPISIKAGFLVDGERSISGSVIGSRGEMVAALQFAAMEGVRPRVELRPMAEAAEALDCVRANQARYRVVLEA